MSDQICSLKGCRVLILEDEYLISADLEMALRSQGAEVIGPFGDLQEAMEQVTRDGFDVAVIDVNLRDEAAYPVADELMRCQVPFIFATGYTAKALPSRFRDLPLWEKPYDTHGL